MFKVSRILVLAHVLGICAVALSACGQKGPLVHPQDPLAADRATLLQTLTPHIQSERDVKLPIKPAAKPEAATSQTPTAKTP
jgi:predicted small lipoprotein YifL